VGLRLAFRPLPASSLREAAGTLPGMQRAGQTWLSHVQAQAAPVLGAWFRDHAATALRRAVAATPQLSAAPDLERAQARMLERMAELRREPRRGACGMNAAPRRRSCLRQSDGFAYHQNAIG